MIGRMLYRDGQLRPAVAYGIICAVVAVAGYMVYTAWAGSGSSRPVAMMCMTPDCGYTRSERLQVGETFPAPCPRCGKNSLVPAFVCKECGTVNVWNEDRGLSPPTRCTKCGREVYHGR